MNSIVIIGPGYVGLPLSLQFARSGCRVPGLDIDPAKTGARNAVAAAMRTTQFFKA
jgi:UDP-N-acetyl-D-glucosamine dehydrogenase